MDGEEVEASSDNFVNPPKILNLKLSHSTQNMIPLSESQPISHYGRRRSIVSDRYLRRAAYQQFDPLDSVFDYNNSNAFFRNRSIDDECAAHQTDSGQNVIFTGQLQSRVESWQLSQIRPNAHGQPHRSISGLHSKQSEDERPHSKDSINKEKRKLTRRYFVTVLSISYAIFLVVFGAIIFIGDVVESQYPLPQTFCIYMLLMAFSYFLYLYVDIRLHVYRAKEQIKTRLERKEMLDEYVERFLLNDGRRRSKGGTHDDAFYAQAIRELNLPALKSISHKYCFASGRHGKSLYLKLGASWFAFGFLVYSALQVSYEAYFISSNGNYLHECASYITLALNVLFPLYSLFSLFFIVKYMNVVINVNQSIARIGLLHAIGTSLTLWVFTIIHETTDAIAESDAKKYALHHLNLPNETYEFVFNDCGKSNALNAVHRQFAPYLYPFVIEYCILLVGIWYKIYENLDQCPSKQLHSNTNDDKKIDKVSNEKNLSTMALSVQDQTTEHEDDIGSSFYVYADCQSSFRGIFVGLLLVIMTIVFIILMFVSYQHRSFLKTSISINNIFKCSTLLVLLAATLFAYTKTMKLDFSHPSTLNMDDILLLITVPAFFIDCIFSLTPAIRKGAFLPIAITICRILQVLIQTPFIVDGRRRCSNTSMLREKKIGRGFIIFLAIANMSLWIYTTFSGKTVYASDNRYEFYGATLWNILNHISLPLIMFYRFHDSVCLVEIWNHAYEPAEME